MTILDFHQRKIANKKISMITCYDFTSALIAAQSNVDLLLVGDSLAMTMLGEKNTLNCSTETICLHVQSVARANQATNPKFIVGDMPFMSFRKSLSESSTHAEQIMKAGAHAVKLEGADGNLELVRHLTQSGIPVMGHLGLTPQSIHMFGGFKVQGRDDVQQKKILDDAKALQDAGCFAVVLECVPASLAEKVTAALEIPTIGIGAGHKCDGQVLVWQDLLGMNPGFKPKFVRTYMNGFEQIQTALNQFHNDVQNENFPSEKESYLS